MLEVRTTRRRTAIPATDVVGYSRLMAAKAGLPYFEGSK
jgi:hypothetical protein